MAIEVDRQIVLEKEFQRSGAMTEKDLSQILLTGPGYYHIFSVHPSPAVSCPLGQPKLFQSYNKI